MKMPSREAVLSYLCDSFLTFLILVLLWGCLLLGSYLLEWDLQNPDAMPAVSALVIALAFFAYRLASAFKWLLG